MTRPIEPVTSTPNGGLPWVFDDGGRRDAGYRGTAGDCVVRAICIGIGEDYGVLYKQLAQENRDYWSALSARHQAKAPMRAAKYAKQAVATARHGIPDPVWQALLTERGLERVHLPKGSRLTDLPIDRMVIAVLRRHLVAVDHGTIRDTFDSSYGYDRLAFSYWQLTEAQR